MGDYSKPPLLLIHGFGASAYHFRHNIPDLAKDYHVYAFDMLGFGLSSKPIQDYGAEVWRDQTLDFIEQVIRRPTTVAGNSLGGFTALYAASSERGKKMILGCISLNGAGRFRDPSAPVQLEKKDGLGNKIAATIQRLVIGASFLYTKQPARIEQVLRQVYPVNADKVDEELVKSIHLPSLDPNAAEVFYRVITKNASKPGVYIDDLLQTLECPLLLCWGERDPWIRSAAADRMQALYPKSKRVSIEAGHCPHDEAPEHVNSAIREFVREVTSLSL
jgi:pimeloyl-ACP methyl ester carboxylesterase